MADIVSEIIDDIQSDIDSGYYDLDNFDIQEAIWETLDNKLIYDYDIIEYWQSTDQDSISEIRSLMSDDITEHVNSSISDADFNFPDDFTANRRAMRARPTNRRRMANSRRRANHRSNRRARYDYSVADAVDIARDIYNNASADLIEAIEILWTNPYSTLLNQHVANELERRGNYHITDFPSIPAILSGMHAGQSDQEIINLVS